MASFPITGIVFVIGHLLVVDNWILLGLSR